MQIVWNQVSIYHDNSVWASNFPNMRQLFKKNSIIKTELNLSLTLKVFTGRIMHPRGLACMSNFLMIRRRQKFWTIFAFYLNKLSCVILLPCRRLVHTLLTLVLLFSFHWTHLWRWSWSLVSLWRAQILGAPSYTTFKPVQRIKTWIYKIFYLSCQ